MNELQRFLEDLRSFNAEREWSQFHDPKNLSMLLTSEAGELLALLRWVPNTEADAYASQPAARQQLTEEIGDVGIALLLLCDRLGIDLLLALRAKLDLNRAKYPVEQSRGRWTKSES
ncbi:MazG-like family protein [Corallococcus coralloides]|uniref:MazG-like family protein n=1 Tax=Corallococcus coralloides TaxID=184914 RepID=UPI0005BD99C6|nr:nucleotide pyrophosphohydrolase [Corallococcus coralloides]